MSTRVEEVVVVVGTDDEEVVANVVSGDGEVMLPESPPQAANARLAVNAIKRALGRQSTRSMLSVTRR